MLFLGLLDSLGLSSGVSTDGLRNLSLDIDAHALGDTLGNIVGDVLDDGSAGHTVLGGHGGGGVGQVGGADEELGVGLSLPLAVNVGDDSGDGVLDVSAGGLLDAGDVPADNNGLGGAVGLGVASLANNNGLSDNLADGGGNDMSISEVSISEPVSKKELRVGVSFSRGGGEGGGGQEGETKGNLEEGVLRNYS